MIEKKIRGWRGDLLRRIAVTQIAIDELDQRDAWWPDEADQRDELEHQKARLWEKFSA